MLSARGILTALSLLFLGLALRGMTAERSFAEPAARTWLVVGSIFGLVSAWLWIRRS